MVKIMPFNNHIVWLKCNKKIQTKVLGHWLLINSIIWRLWLLFIMLKHSKIFATRSFNNSTISINFINWFETMNISIFKKKKIYQIFVCFFDLLAQNFDIGLYWLLVINKNTDSSGMSVHWACISVFKFSQDV